MQLNLRGSAREFLEKGAEIIQGSIRERAGIIQNGQGKEKRAKRKEQREKSKEKRARGKYSEE